MSEQVGVLEICENNCQDFGQHSGNRLQDNWHVQWYVAEQRVQGSHRKLRKPRRLDYPMLR